MNANACRTHKKTVALGMTAWASDSRSAWRKSRKINDQSSKTI